MDTVEQLLFRESEETGENICNPCFTQLTPWKDHVKVAIIVARQEALDLAKDGKTLLGPVLPVLLARHDKGSLGGKSGGRRKRQECGDQEARP